MPETMRRFTLRCIERARKHSGVVAGWIVLFLPGFWLWRLTGYVRALPADNFAGMSGQELKDTSVLMMNACCVFYAVGVGLGYALRDAISVLADAICRVSGWSVARLTRRSVAGVAALGTVLCIAAPRASAQLFGGPMYCVNCSSEMTALASRATQAMQLIHEAQTALRAIQMATLMVKESQALVNNPHSNILTDLTYLSNIATQSQGLAGTMAQMDYEFRTTYGNYSGPDPAMSFALKYGRWSDMSLKTINGSLLAAGYQSGMLQNEGLWMRQIQAMNQTPLGRDQALQLGNTIAAEEVAQLQSLRALMIADMESKAAFTAQQVNAQSAQQVAQESGFTYVQPVADSRVW
jgi:type IV secretion system protein TrbJ